MPGRPPNSRRRRSLDRGVPVPEGVLDGQTVRYTEDELTTWEKQTGDL
ncbi:hypothetical protein OG249_09910 [Streptomyces microflavus]|nr:hypothetical protein [Streptomyces microflavus]MCX4652212.1 hypothetical protein [Streptomyces microflavus]